MQRLGFRAPSQEWNEGLDDEGYVDFHLLNENAENEPNRSNAILGRKKVDGGVHSTGSMKKGTHANVAQRDRAKPGALKPVKTQPKR